MRHRPGKDQAQPSLATRAVVFRGSPFAKLFDCPGQGSAPVSLKCAVDPQRQQHKKLTRVNQDPRQLLPVLVEVPAQNLVAQTPLERLAPTEGIAVDHHRAEVHGDSEPGEDHGCVASFDNLRVVPKAYLVGQICELTPARLAEACAAIQAAIDC